MKNHPGKFVLGEGREMAHREAEDPGKHFCLFSPDITCDQELFVPIVMTYL